MKKSQLSLLFCLAIPTLIFAQGDSSNFFPIDWTLLLSALLGCALQEFIYWYELRSASTVPVPTPFYLKATSISMLLFPLGTYLYFSSSGEAGASFFTVAIFAAGFPRLFKSAVGHMVPPNPNADPKETLENMATRQEGTAESSPWRNYLLVN